MTVYFCLVGNYVPLRSPRQRTIFASYHETDIKSFLLTVVFLFREFAVVSLVLLAVVPRQLLGKRCPPLGEGQMTSANSLQISAPCVLKQFLSYEAFWAAEGSSHPSEGISKLSLAGFVLVGSKRGHGSVPKNKAGSQLLRAMCCQIALPPAQIRWNRCANVHGKSPDLLKLSFSCNSQQFLKASQLFSMLLFLF